MTAEEYAAIEHPLPYVVRVEKEHKRVVFFGSPHTRDRHDPVLKEIEREFLAENPDMVFIEGMGAMASAPETREKFRERSIDEAVATVGEPGFTYKLAVDHDVPVESPEPRTKDQIQHLLDKGFSKEEVFALRFMSALYQYRLVEGKPFKEYIAPYLENFARASGWEGFDYSLEHARNIAEKIIGEEIDLTDPGRYQGAADPITRPEQEHKETALNRASREETLFRDQYMIGRIAAVLEDHDRLFIVYGASHAVMDERAVRGLLR